MTSVRPSVRLSVCLSITLVDCDHIVQQKVDSLGYLHAEADPDRNPSEVDQWDIELE